MTQGELSEDPRDFIASHLVVIANGMTLSTHNFAIFFLMSHGIIKVLLVIGLLKRVLWAYHLAIVAFTLFVIYQVYRYYLYQSPWMIFLTIVDIAIIVLTWLEYRRLKCSATVSDCPEMQ